MIDVPTFEIARNTGPHDFEYGEIVDDIQILFQPGDTRCLLDPDFAIIGYTDARQELEQGRLALTVAADYADALPLADQEFDLIEQRSRAERQRNPG